ncbi:histone-lysine N-methyltransferase SETMAR-like [Euwallacea fornicatus]|uniref:histone-lysine N-methyltransferase SETMAR-like n=1 Tax=Euwallacea fornicatus TaxID=995702 RepID=UPI0033903D5C
MLVNNRKLTIREIVEDVSIAYEFIQNSLVNDLGFNRVAAKLVPKDLNFIQKRDRVDVAKDIIFEAESDPTFIKRIITGDDTWVYKYDTQSGHQESEWRSPNEPTPKKPRRFQSKKKAMLTVFMDYNGVVHHEFFPEGQTPPNSPDLAPCDFFLFNRVKKPLRGTRFSSREEVIEKSQEALMDIPKTEYKKCFEDWIKRWHKCVAVDGDYFEGDNIDLDELT